MCLAKLWRSCGEVLQGGADDGAEVCGGDGPGAGVEVCTDEGVCAVVGGGFCGDGEVVYGAGEADVFAAAGGAECAVHVGGDAEGAEAVVGGLEGGVAPAVYAGECEGEGFHDLRFTIYNLRFTS